MTFLPPDYTPPQTGHYMRFENGDNRFRILAPAITGSEFWSTDREGNRQPNRRRPGVAVGAHELGIDKFGKPEKVKHFWAFPVWNPLAKQIQILQVTQKSVQDGIRALSESPQWGDPVNKYDLVVAKSGANLDTEYMVHPVPPSPTPQEILNDLAVANLNMEALYDNEDPFGLDTGAQGPSAPPQQSPQQHQQSLSQQPPQGQQPPQQQPPQPPLQQEEMITATVQQVNVDGKVFWIETNEGQFATTDEKIGTYLSARTGSPMDLTFVRTAKGTRKLVLAIPQVHEAIDEADIPFDVAV